MELQPTLLPQIEEDLSSDTALSGVTTTCQHFCLTHIHHNSLGLYTTFPSLEFPRQFPNTQLSTQGHLCTAGGK